MMGFIIGIILIIILMVFIHCCFKISSRCSEIELHEIYKEAYKNYRENEKSGELNDSSEK